jgi:hypothetical protein
VEAHSYQRNEDDSMNLLRGMGLAALLFACGCGGAGSSTASGGSSGVNPAGGGGGGSNPNPSGINLNFSIAGFGGAQQATLLKRNMPATEQSGSATANSSSSNRLLARAELEGKDMPLELLEQESARLRQLPVEPAEAPVRPKFQEIPEGGAINFFIVTSGLTVSCQKMHADNETTHSSIFAEVVGGNPVIDKTKALEIAAAFDSNNPFLPGQGIYDQDRDLFGSEWTSSGGRDGDAKITLVFLSPGSIGGANFFGFFRPTDEYSKAQFSTSNEGEILYLNANKAVGDNFDVLGTIAHEFEHLIAFNTKLAHQGAFDGTQENAGVDEGKAVLAEDLLGFGLTAPSGGSGFVFRVCQGFLNNPARVGLFTFDGGIDCYGRGYTLMRYIVDRFGLPAFQSYAKSSGIGLSQLNASFGGFSPLFGDWQMALLASPLAGPVPGIWKYGPAFSPTGSYNIRGSGVSTLPGLTPTQVVSPPGGVQPANLPAWAIGTVVYRNGTGNTLNLNLQGDSTIGGGVLIENPQGTFSGVR